MQVSLQRMINNVRAEKQACMRVYEIFIIVFIVIIPVTAFTGDILSAFIYIALAIMTMILSIRLFRDMHSQTQADVILSLPMTARERYLSKLLVFIRCAVIPLMVCCAVSIIAAFLSGRFIYENKVYGLGNYASSVSMMFLGGLCVMMFCAAVTFICCTFTSSAVYGAVSSVIAILTLALIPYNFYTYIMLPSAGIAPVNEYYRSGIIYNLLGLDPVMSIIIDEGEFEQMIKTEPGRWTMLTLANTLISVIILLMGAHIYKRRDKSSLTHNALLKPFVPAITALAAIYIMLFAVKNNYSYLPYGLLISGLLVIMLFIKRGGFMIRRSFGWLLGYIGAIVGFIGFCALVFFTDGLFISKLPRHYREIESYKLYSEYFYIDDNGKSLSSATAEATAQRLDREDLSKITAIADKYKEKTATTEMFAQLIGLKGKRLSDYFLFYNDYYYDEEDFTGIDPLDDDLITIFINYDPYFTLAELDAFEEEENRLMNQSSELEMELLTFHKDRGADSEIYRAATIEGVHYHCLMKKENAEKFFSELNNDFNAEIVIDDGRSYEEETDDALIFEEEDYE